MAECHTEKNTQDKVIVTIRQTTACKIELSHWKLTQGCDIWLCLNHVKLSFYPKGLLRPSFKGGWCFRLLWTFIAQTPIVHIITANTNTYASTVRRIHRPAAETTEPCLHCCCHRPPSAGTWVFPSNIGPRNSSAANFYYQPYYWDYPRAVACIYYSAKDYLANHSHAKIRLILTVIMILSWHIWSHVLCRSLPAQTIVCAFNLWPFIIIWPALPIHI